MRRTLAVLMDPIEKIKIYKDSTFAMLLEAQKRGYALNYLQQRGLSIRNGVAFGQSQGLAVRDDASSWFTLGASSAQPLGSFDVILARLDPPFDTEYLHDTQMLDMAVAAGSLVVNRPQAVRDFNEKLYTLQFPNCVPRSLVARDPQLLKEFVLGEGVAVAKILDAMGGASVFKVSSDDPNLNVILETVTQEGRQLALVQQYLPEISQGDKRILMINGQPVPFALARIPAAGEFRGNLARGGSGVARALTPRDREIAASVGPALVRNGIYFAGLDVIGDYLTEINVTSPTCIRELDAACGLNIAGDLFDALEAELT